MSSARAVGSRRVEDSAEKPAGRPGRGVLFSCKEMQESMTDSISQVEFQLSAQLLPRTFSTRVRTL